jgi:hypothetical protein
MPTFSTSLFLFLSCPFLLLVACKDNVERGPESALTISETDSAIQIQFEGKTLLNYFKTTQFPPDTLPDYYKRSGFIHPVNTLSGRTITDGFPRGHTHQHGIFNAWTKTTFQGSKLDFWNQQEQLGSVRHKRVINVDPSTPSFRVELEHLAHQEKDTTVVLEEFWDITIEVKDKYYVLDLSSTQTCVSKDSLILDKYHYGGMAFRGADEWNYKNNYDSLCYFTTSDTLNHIDANHSRPTWASMYGYVDNMLAGVAIIPHSSNLRYPSHIRIHPSMPYFCFIPTVENAFVFRPGMILTSRYRYVVFDGKFDATLIEEEQANWAL